MHPFLSVFGAPFHNPFHYGEFKADVAYSTVLHFLSVADITNQSQHSSLLRLDVDSDYFNLELQLATTNHT